MASLLNQPINTTYEGLLKTTDNAAIGASEKLLTDGVGNNTTLSVGTSSASFTGTLDLSGATVTGLPGGAPGLVAGTAADSMRSSDTLTTIPAQADSINNISIGNGAQANGGGGFPRQNVAIGHNSRSNSENGTAVGGSAQAGTYAFAGGSASANGLRGVAVGLSANAGAFCAVSVGNYSNANHEAAVCIGGYGANSNGDFAIAIGREVQATTDAIAMGRLANASATGAVALGQGVAASTANTVTIKKLQMLDYASLNYADDTAAAAGGIPLGGVYHTSGALKIRIV